MCILVTSALPYANGEMHLGHIMEQVQADIWVRFKKITNNECLHVCADDSHGTPIMLEAEKKNISPKEMIKYFQTEHKLTLESFNIYHDNYHTTHSIENYSLSKNIFKKLNKKNYIFQKKINQSFDPIKKIFLPDRYVKGTCPKCNKTNQYGDNCEGCGSSYEPMDLKNPISVLSGKKPIMKETKHLFLNIEKFKTELKQSIKKIKLQKEILKNTTKILNSQIQEWNISRDNPYFGFKVPGYQDKYFYVWYDAPIGYISSFKNLCNKNKKINFNKYWNKNSNTQLIQFIGKDIIYFHTIFWPSILIGGNFRIPNEIFVHGFLTINGKKMSKSKNTFIIANKFSKYVNAEYLRYYLSSKLNNKIEDIDLDLKDFVEKINSDLIGKFINIGSRCASIINKNFKNKLSMNVENDLMIDLFLSQKETIYNYFEEKNFSKAINKIMNLADKANKYINEMKPWKLKTTTQEQENAQKICTVGISLFKILTYYLKPIIPEISKKIELTLNIKGNINDLENYLSKNEINKFIPIIERLNLKFLEKKFLN